MKICIRTEKQLSCIIQCD